MARRKLGFIDLETDANGNTILAEEWVGVSDKVMEELKINKTKYDKQVQEQRARKKIDIVTPVQGISREEYKKGMLRSDEYFKNVWHLSKYLKARSKKMFFFHASKLN